MVASSRIGIIGVGEPGYRLRIESTLPELVHNAARAALTDTRLDRGDIENVVACASDLDDGRAISSMMTSAPGGAFDKDFVKTTDTGVHAIDLAMLRMQSGLFSSTLVLSWGKESEADLSSSVHLEGDPFFRRGIGLGRVTGHALQAAAFDSQQDDAATAAAKLAAHDTKMGSQNPRVSGCEPIDESDVQTSDVVAWPLRSGHLPAKCDGATALVLATEEFINDRELANDPVWIEGVGRQTATYNAGNRPFGRLAALETAANRAYETASLTDPAEAVEAAEIHGQSAYHELMAIDALDLTVNGATRAVLDGEVGGGEKPTINRSGGAMAANPLLGAGLARVAAATRQVRGDGANGESVSRAVAHATAGFTDQTHGVAVLGGDRDA
jgi:acetyl-CoA C-acetyltransferase